MTYRFKVITVILIFITFVTLFTGCGSAQLAELSAGVCLAAIIPALWIRKKQARVKTGA